MHGQGNYTIQVGQDPYVRPPAFQQHPAASTTPATSHYGPLAPQPQVIQHVRPSFHPTRGIAAYQHAIPSVQHQGPPVPVVSGGLSSTQSYFSRPPHISTQMSHSYPTSDQQPLPWSQNIHQLPASAPLSRPSAYQLPSSQGPPHQPPSHAIPSQLSPYSSSSGALMSDPFGSSVLPMREHSHQQPMVSVLPPPPPPLPCSSPPGVPPLPPSSPSSDILSKRGGGCSLKVPLDGNNLMMERPPPGKPAEDRSAYEADVPVQHSEKNGLKVGSEDALVVHSPTDSDMDMEDDITHPDEEKKNCLSSNSYGECVSKFQEDYGKEQLQLLQHAGGHRLPEIALHGNPLIAKVSVSKTQIGGSEIASDCKFHLTTKVTSEADDSGTLKDGQTRHPLDVTVEQSVSQHKNISEPNVPVLYSETGYRKLSDQEMEGANPFKLLQGYASNNTSENEEENLLRNVGSCSANDGSTNSDADKGCDFGSELRDKMQADKLSFATGVVEEISDRSHGGRESASILTDARHRKDSRNYDDNTGLDGANLHKSDMKSYSNKLNVDEFGRLVREGVSDSDASDSPRYARRHARRARKRSRSRSRSQSPHDRRRRRRRSPWRRKERRSRSRSLSPKRRRSKSRSPVIRRDSEFGGDKPRRERGQLPECFDFLRGKCYRGATCRYSHHESDKSERLRYNRGKQHYRDMPPSLQSPDFQESKVLPDKEMKDKVLRLPQDMPGSREAKDAKRLPVESITEFPSKLDSRESGSLLAADVLAGNRSGYSAHDMPSGEDKSLVSEFAVQYSDEIPQTVDPQGKRTDDILVPESSTPPQALAATSTRHPADKSVGSLAKPYASEEVSCQSSKELLPSNANRPSQLTLPLPSALQGASAPVAQPIAQDYNSKPPLSWNNLTPENYSPCEAPAAYQHSHFPGPLKSLPSSFCPPPPPPPPPPPTTAGHSISSQQIQQSLLPPWNGLSSYASMQAQPTELPNPSLTGGYQAYPLARGPDQMLHSTDGFGSSSLHPSNQTGQQGGPHVMGEDRLTGHSVQVTNPSLSQGQSNILLIQSASKGMHGSIGGGLPSDSNSVSRTYFQQASYGPQYSGAGGVVAVQHAEPGMVGSSASRITADFLERNHSYVRDIVESRVSNYFNPYAPNLPQSSKFSSDALTHEHDTTINTRYGAQVGLSTAALDTHEIASLGSKNISVFPRPGGDQYDPLFDSIEPASNSFSKADHQKHETTGDSDDVLKFGGSGRVLTMEGTKMEGGTAASANDSLENEEYGETADVAVDAVLNGTPSNPNDATEMNAGEFEIDQVKTSGKKKSKERSMKLFKVSIATFVKEVLKPSWRQGNMSKEAFKTIVKKTVDKVSGAMKSHQIPKSQAKINHYIDSSRGKLTKLVMGYVDKYVKV